MKRFLSPSSQLPAEALDRITRPFMHFLRIQSAAGIVLLLCTLLAVGWANSPFSATYFALWEMTATVTIGSFELAGSLRHWINDGLMTLFFFVVALELKREIVLGELRNPRTAALSFIAALGGMVFPAVVFLALEGGGAGAHGWGTVMATDTAFVIACLAILGSRVPLSLRLFLLSAAIFDDIGAILIVAIGYGDSLSWVAVAWAGIGLSLVAGLAWLGVRSIVIYVFFGIATWLAFDESGIHPTLVGVILGLMTPARSWVSDRRLQAILARVTAYAPGEDWSGDTSARQDLRRATVATREALSPVERLEIILHPWVAFVIMPLFALANAGVSVAILEIDVGIVTAIMAGFIVGKPMGVLAFSYVAVRLHMATLPTDMSWRMLAAGGMLTGIGFTMALFIAELAFAPALLNSAKIGILLASVVAATVGLAVLFRLAPPATASKGS